MRTSVPFQLILLVLFFFPSPSFAKGFQTYSQEVILAKLVLECSTEEDIPATKNFGALYICTFGKAKTAKWYVSEKPKTGMVQNIGLIWVDWQIDIGYGSRADWKEVEKALDFMIYWYVPTRRKDLLKAFWDSKNEDFNTPDFMIYYTFKAGSQKTERLVVVEGK